MPRRSVDTITHAILIFAGVAVTGLMLGSIRIRGIGIGPAGVLFAGILFGHFGAKVEHEIAEFAKEFGLILFVFTIGLQLGPGIVQLWRKQGWLLNGLALAIVAQGLMLVLVLHWAFGISVFATAGLFSGATTNTPSLGAAQQAALAVESTSQSQAGTMAAAYAVSYPGGILGIIAAMLLLRFLFRINVSKEAEGLKADAKADQVSIERHTILLDNPHMDGKQFGKIPGLEETGVRISRIQRHDEEEVHVATEQTVLRCGDRIQVVGSEEALERFEPLLGIRDATDLMTTSGDVLFRRVLVTEPSVLNVTLNDLSLDHIHNVTVTRIRRAGVEVTARGTSRFHYGDVANIVGDEPSLDRVTKLLGNSVKSLNETRFAPIFLGIVVGIFLGMMPLHVPGLPHPVKLGLAGGPLVAAIALSLIGNVGRIVWYIPHGANLALRELGIILFLVAAGLSADETFFHVAFTSVGVQWMLIGIIVTMVPLLITGIAARLFAKLNFLTICGVVAGSMTDPPALTFANSLSDSDGCSTAYAAVYPLTMILRILAAQTIVYSIG